MRRKAPKIGFDDMPRELHSLEDDDVERLALRHAWLEGHGLSVVDYFAWLRSRQLGAHRRPSSRRKWMTEAQLAALDAERENEGDPLKW